MDEPKPCPKCGCLYIESADDIGYDDYWYCIDCGYMEHKETWNTRAMPPVSENHYGLEAALDKTWMGNTKAVR